MTREELTARIHELADEVKAAGVGVKMLSGARLAEHLERQPDHMLRRIRRVYEDLLDAKRHQAGCAPPVTQTARP